MYWGFLSGSPPKAGVLQDLGSCRDLIPLVKKCKKSPAFDLGDGFELENGNAET